MCDMKTCTKCNVEKELSEFSKDKKAKDGLNYNCKSCCREYSQANKEKIKEYYQANKEKIKKYKKEYNQANKEKIKKYFKEYRQDNKEKIKERNKEYKQANKEKIKEYQKERRKNDHLFKMRCNLGNRTSQAFKNKGYSKNTKTQEMLGVDWKIAKAHIERQFIKGMNWNNYGEWHIDHIIPLASANTKEELKKLCHFTNLQPLWAKDNLIKSNKIDNQQIILRI